MSMTRMLGVTAVTALLSLSAIGAAGAAPPPPPTPHFQFGIQLGNGDGYDPGPGDSCLSDREIYVGLRAQGYRHIQLVDDSGDTSTFDAVRKNRLYELEVDSCSGDILSRTRIYHY